VYNCYKDYYQGGIGSIVDIRDAYDQTVETVHIVSPFLNQGQVNYTFASYLSPMGRELLLKRKGDKVMVKLPAGYSHYIINDIRLSC
jgi:transcription elongation factor GreA